MPKYLYKCDRCDHLEEEIRSGGERDWTKICNNLIRKNETTLVVCGGSMIRQFARTMEPSIMETADTYRNVKHRKDQDRRVRERAKKFFLKNEVNELIEKVGEKDAKKFGWLGKDGKKNK